MSDVVELYEGLEGAYAKKTLQLLQSYRRYERFGTSFATGKQSLEERKQKQLTHLRSHEHELYDMLCDPSFAGFRRIEQERIPLEDAVHAVGELMSASGEMDFR